MASNSASWKSTKTMCNPGQEVTNALKNFDVPFDVTWNLERFVPHTDAQMCGNCKSIYINIFEGDWDWVGSFTYPGFGSCEKCPPKKDSGYKKGSLPYRLKR